MLLCPQTGKKAFSQTENVSLCEGFLLERSRMPYKDPEQQRECERRWRIAHLGQARASSRRYAKAHLEEGRERNRRWRERHLEEQREYQRQWHVTHLEKCNAISRKRRALKQAASIGKVDYKAIMERDKMICGICHKRIARKDLSFDHIIPLSCGGAHTESNLQVAHRRCNSRKGIGYLPSQIRLVME